MDDSNLDEDVWNDGSMIGLNTYCRMLITDISEKTL